MGTSMANRLLKSGVIGKYNVTSVTSLLVGGAPLKEESQAELQKAFQNSLVLQAYGKYKFVQISFQFIYKLFFRYN